MNRIAFPGCRTDPLGSYLQGLGAWRAVTRVADADARAHWEGRELVLTTSLDAEQVLTALRDDFTPLPIVSPWNAGSGFAANGKNVEAERALETVRNSADPRFARLRAAVLVADEIVTEGRRRGWGGAKEEMWDKSRKTDVVRLCRNRLPDDALPWIDTAIVLGQDDEPTYSRLLGTGANFGRQDLSTTYVQRALNILLDKTSSRRSEAWLRAALFGDESVPYLRGTVGQFDPVRAGGIQTSTFEKADDSGFANPWSTLLTFEGTLFFASAVVRRQGALSSRVAVPFQVRASAVGFSSNAPDEKVLGEIWTPEWDRPARLAEIEQLLGEGRADWRGRPARTGLDFVRAIASLGVDRGLSHFTRHVFGERLGQNPLAVPVGRVAVTWQGPVGLLAEVDPWLDRLRQVTNAPASVEARLRQVDAALYAVARGVEGALRDVVVSLGRLHEAVSRSGTSREQVSPLMIRNAAGWWEALRPDTAELRVAGALASGADRDKDRRLRFGPVTLRLLLTPVEAGRGGTRLDWTERPPPVPWVEDVITAVAQAHRRRALPGAVTDPADDPAHPAPAVRGVLTAFAHGLTVPPQDVTDVVTGRLDDGLVGDYLRGLLLLDWSTASGAQLPTAIVGPRLPAPAPAPPPALAALLPFFVVDPLPLRLNEVAPMPEPVVLRPGPEWVATLLAVGPGPVLGDAMRRLRAAGIGDTVTAETLARTDLFGSRLAAALLLRVPRSVRIRALTRVALLPDQRSVQPSFVTATAPTIEDAPDQDEESSP